LKVNALSSTDRELLRIVGVDLAALRKSWGVRVDDDELRRSSSALRRLLVQGDYSRAWRLIHDKEPRVRAMDLAPTLEPYGAEHAMWAQAGGGKFGGVQVAHMVVWDFALTPEQIKQKNRSSPQMTTFGLRKFLHSPSIVVRGTVITRGDIISYVANKLGGSHLDPTRSGAEERFSFLDEGLAHLAVANKRAPYFELLSIGQAVLRSSDAARLIKISAQSK
jgi:hypothetical protein